MYDSSSPRQCQAVKLFTHWFSARGAWLLSMLRHGSCLDMFRSQAIPHVAEDFLAQRRELLSSVRYWIRLNWNYYTVWYKQVAICNVSTSASDSFLANVNSRSRSLYAIARPSVVCLSVVCNVRAPYSGGSDFRQYFYGIRYLGHPWTSAENFTEIVPGEPLRQGS